MHCGFRLKYNLQWNKIALYHLVRLPPQLLIVINIFVVAAAAAADDDDDAAAAAAASAAAAAAAAAAAELNHCYQSNSCGNMKWNKFTN